jgi:hypothetical protein
MSPPVQVATDPLATLQFPSSNSAIAAYIASLLQVDRRAPPNDLTWMYGPFGLALCASMFAAAWRVLERRPDLWWWSVLVIALFLPWFLWFWRVADEMIEHWHLWIVLLMLAVAVALGWWWYLFT